MNYIWRTYLMIPYKYLAFGGSPAKGMWDQTLLDDIFTDKRFGGEGEGSIVVIPAAYQAKHVDKINTELNKLEWCVLILTSDEESKFPVEKINHKNIRIYVQYPKQGRHDEYRFLFNGYTPHTRENLELIDKDIDWVFAGQVTHDRRRECVQQLKLLTNGKLIETEGFTQGLKPKEYIGLLNKAKVAPCPSGPVTADSFRLYEALEAGCIPIADSESKTGTDYWDYMFPDCPFPTIKDYDDLPGYIEDQLEDWKPKANRIQAWWIKKKHDLKQQLIEDVAELSGKKYNHAITVVIPTSVIPSHPSTHILDETIKSIREQLPDADIYLLFDGIREQQRDRQADYDEYIRRVLFKANTQWGSVIPILYETHKHQSGLMRDVLDKITTPLILFMEHDTGLDGDIDWRKCSEVIMSGQLNIVRFHFEGVLPKEHLPMMIDSEPIQIGGIKVLRTAQFSARPHLASTAFYKKMIKDNFPLNAVTMVEDVVHGPVWNDYRENGVMGWNNWRIGIYFSEDGVMKHSTTSDGREDDPKFDMDYGSWE